MFLLLAHQNQAVLKPLLTKSDHMLTDIALTKKIKTSSDVNKT